jgi:hypothetical protein
MPKMHNPTLRPLTGKELTQLMILLAENRLNASEGINQELVLIYKKNQLHIKGATVSPEQQQQLLLASEQHNAEFKYEHKQQLDSINLVNADGTVVQRVVPTDQSQPQATYTPLLAAMTSHHNPHASKELRSGYIPPAANSNFSIKPDRPDMPHTESDLEKKERLERQRRLGMRPEGL